MVLILGIPIILVLSSVCFDSDLKSTTYQKIGYFLILPVIEITVVAVAIKPAQSIGVNLIEAWQGYLFYFSISLGIIGTMIISLVEELNCTVKLIIRVTILAVFSYIITRLLLGF